MTSLRSCNSGNATMLVAMGMPVLIGSAGLAVDVSQWYMWKRELQFATDQAAIAGAWAMTDSETESTYTTRATQEYTANLDITFDFADDAPVVALANYAGGTANSVTVSATATRTLPFSSFLTGTGVTVAAFSQASFNEGTTFTSCLIAVDEDDSGAITIGGTAVMVASCGMAALSDAEEAITVNGNPEIDAGWILARGGVDPWLFENTDDVILENMEGLFDPFEDLVAPEPASSQTRRTYSCEAQADSTVADVTTRTQVTYTYWVGRNTNSLTSSNTGLPSGYPRTNTDDSNTQYAYPVVNGSVAGSDLPSDHTAYVQIGGSGNAKKYQKTVTTTTVSRANVVVTPGTPAGSVVPGTYEAIHISCDTTFAPGIYIIEDGGLKITGHYEVNGSGVLFVLKDGGWIDFAGGSDITLTGMQVAELIDAGVSADDANDLAGMLVFEDRESEGTSKNKINGNAATVLNGTFYFPVSNIDFMGTASVTSQCLMIAAATINLTGTTNMESFCPAGSSEDDAVATTESTVRLVA